MKSRINMCHMITDVYSGDMRDMSYRFGIYCRDI